MRLINRTLYASAMSRDSNRTYVHFNNPRTAELFEDFCRDKIPNDDVYVPPHHQPINPEDEDDVIPDQHVYKLPLESHELFKKTHETAWKDLGLQDLMKKAPAERPRRLPR
ncbi:Apc13p protein-domain-containing protein [Kalaharituber pfeilii]|nr:Apc13p protein-domain-containing protein [Kalaharituber pfeilii]